MKQKFFMGVMTLTAVMGLTACGQQPVTETVQEETAVIQMTESEAETAETTEEIPEAEEPAKEIFQSSLGYSMEYDPSLFEITSDESSDCFQQKGQDLTKEVPNYITISLSEYSVEDTVEGLILQSGQDGITADETTMGQENYPSQCFAYAVEDDPRGNLYMSYQILEIQGKVYQMEMGSGDELSLEMQNEVEEMLASFQAGEASEATAENSVDYSVFTNLGSQEVKAFAESVQVDFANADWASLSEKISYPITIDSVTYQNAEEFAATDFGAIFSDAFLKAIEETDTSCLFANFKGAMFGDGEIWFAELLDGEGNSEGLKIITIQEIR